MVDVLKKLQYPPWRRRVLRAVLAFPFVVGPVCFFLMGPAEGLVIFLAGFGVYALRSDLPARPNVKVAFSNDQATLERMIIAPDRPRLDLDRILDNSCGEARKTMPRLPTPAFPEGTAPGAIFASARTSMLYGALEPSDAELNEFLDKVSAYGERLEAWLQEYDEARVLRLREFETSFRIDNDGEAAAQSLRLRLRFPKEFLDLSDDDLPVDEPPKRPTFSRGPVFPSIAGLASENIRPIFNAPLPDVIKGIAPTYFRDQDHLIVEYKLGTLNHGPDYLRTSLCELRAPGGGVYEIEWEISAGNLPEAASGKLELEVRTPELSDAALTTVDEVLSEREELRLE